MLTVFTLMVIVIAIALIFDFFNGFHDAANSISTIVVTKTLTPAQALLMAGVANFIGYFGFLLGFETAVAKTIGKGVINIDAISLSILLHVLLAALLGAVLWNIITWLLGLPTSSSHALIGGLIGGGIAAAGLKAVVVTGVLKIVAFIVVAPLLGMLGAVVITIITMHIFKKSSPQKSKKAFKYLQIAAALLNSVGHGTNDAQKTMGIIAMALLAGGQISSFHLTGWVVLACYGAISLGTMFGGWRIIKTMGTQISKIGEMEGFCSSAASSLVLFGTSHFGIPVSTTHVIAGTIMGVGTVEGAASVRWITARKIIWAWILTIPLTGLCSALTYYLVSPFMP